MTTKDAPAEPTVDVINKSYDTEVKRKKVGRRKLSIELTQPDDVPGVVVELFDLRIPQVCKGLPEDFSPLPLDSTTQVRILLGLFHGKHLTKTESKRYLKQMKRRIGKDAHRVNDALKVAEMSTLHPPQSAKKSRLPNKVHPDCTFPIGEGGVKAGSTAGTVVPPTEPAVVPFVKELNFKKLSKE